MSLLGIDIGSSSCKGVVFNANGIELARGGQSYSTVNTGPAMVEMDASLIRDAVFNVIRELAKKTTDDPIKAFAISSHGETTIPVDKNGKAVGAAIMNSDNRAIEETEWWETSFGRERIYSITGVPLHSMFSLNKIMWLKKNNPELYNKTDKFLSVGDYILMQLGLPPYTDFSLACRTMAFDINKHDWSEEILTHCDIPKQKLGIPVASGSVAGKLSKEIANELGLNEGVIVALGGHDQPCGALGAGAINSGDVFDSAGTYECMAAVSAAPMNTPQALTYSLNSYCHVLPGKFVTLAFFPAGLVSSWFTDQFCYEEKIIAEQSGKSLFDVLNEKIGVYSPGPTELNITPHFVGSCNPTWDVRAKGVMAGFTPGTTKYHIYKAIHEGIACELSINTEVLDEVVGEFKQMNIAGGNSRSLFTVQLRADLTGKQINILKNDEAVCLGAAILAGIAVGVYKDAADAVSKTVQIEKTVLPDTNAKKQYEKQISRYKVIYPSLAPYREI
ncbi:MAG: hypothetical protein J7497_01135 [Chitinophagaceae bacterium]|nr:hypothetical protein [Chitinophagaceae bacterium]